MRWMELIEVGWGKVKKKPAEQNKKRSRVSRDRISEFEIVYAVTPAPCYFFDGGLSCLDRYPHGIYRALFPTVKKKKVCCCSGNTIQSTKTFDSRLYTLFRPSPFGFWGCSGFLQTKWCWKRSQSSDPIIRGYNYQKREDTNMIIVATRSESFPFNLCQSYAIRRRRWRQLG